MSMIQFTRTEIEWLIKMIEDKINENNEFIVNLLPENSLLRLLKLQNDNLLSVKQRLQYINRDKMIKRVEITK